MFIHIYTFFLWLSISGSIGTVFRLPCHAAMEWRAQHSTPGLLAKSGSGPKPALATRTGTGKGGYRCCLYFWINRNDLAPTSLEWWLANAIRCYKIITSNDWTFQVGELWWKLQYQDVRFFTSVSRMWEALRKPWVGDPSWCRSGFGPATRLRIHRNFVPSPEGFRVSGTGQHDVL